eukprot:508412_1
MAAAADSEMNLMDFLKAFATSITDKSLHRAADFLYHIVGIRVSKSMKSSSKAIIKSMHEDYGSLDVLKGLSEADRKAFAKGKAKGLKTVEKRLIDVLKKQLRAFSKQELTDTKPTDNLKTYLEANELYTFTVGLKPAYSEYYNQLGAFDDSFRYLRDHDDDIRSAHAPPLLNGEYNDVSGSGSPLLIGGVVGASAVVIIMLIFCLGLAFGMVIYWGYTQKR